MSHQYKAYNYLLILGKNQPQIFSAQEWFLRKIFSAKIAVILFSEIF